MLQEQNQLFLLVQPFSKYFFFHCLVGGKVELVVVLVERRWLTICKYLSIDFLTSIKSTI